MKTHFPTLTFLAWLGLSATTVLASGPLTPPGAPAPTMKTLDEIEPRTPISALPFTINQRGSYYLTANLTGSAGANGISINANDVTIDLRGFTLVGVAGSADGIRVTGSRTNIAIYNGVVRDWSNDGIDCSSAYNSQLRDLRTSNNSFEGMQVGTGGLVLHCTSQANGEDGIDAGNGCTITACSASANRQSGITVDDGGIVSDCSASANSLHGIQARSGCRLVNNTGDGNGVGASTGAGLQTTGTENRVEGNNLTGNDTGLHINGTNNIVADNTVRGNADNYAFQPGNQLRLLLSQLPETIDQPATVVLAGSLIGVPNFDGITIATNDVTIDLAGHALAGVPGSRNGITVFGNRTNLVIRNGTLRGWGADGVDANSSYNSQFLELRASGNGTNGIQAGNGAVIRSCTARGNVAAGITTISGSTISDCTASENQRDGIVASTGSAVRGCAAYNNGFNGIAASSGSTVIHCTAYSNTNGISASSGSTVLGCSARNNTTNGIIVSVGCTVSDSTAVSNGTGINTGSDCRIVNNTCDSNIHQGILATGADNRIDGNAVTDNGTGLRANPAIGNFIIRNSASGNTTDYNILPGNFAAQVLTAISGFSATNPFANFTF